MRNLLANTGLLWRQNLRRDWLKITWWLLGIVGLMAAAAAKFGGIYGTQKEMATIAVTLKTPAMVSILGPFTATKPYTTALIYAAEMMVFMGLFVAMMNIYFAVHLTRADEDSGVFELVRAHAVGRQAGLVAAILELIVINLLMAVLAALGLTAANMTGADVAGNWLFGLGLAAFGLMFAAFTLLLAQVAGSASGATRLSYLLLGLLYLVRMGTDVQNPDYTWYTVYGWIEKLDIYATNRWWPLGLMLLATVLAAGVAVALSARRDVGAGLLRERGGRERASRFLAGPLSLIARLERTSTLIWVVGLFVLGATYGSIFGTAGDLMSSNPTMAKLIGATATAQANRTVVLAFSAKLILIFVVVATIPALITLFRLNRDEQKGYLEQLHARGVGRLRLYAAVGGFALITALIAFVAGTLGMALVGNASLGSHAIALSRFARGLWGYGPALIVSFGVAAVLVGWLPRQQGLAWLLPGYGFFSLYLGSLMGFPKWAKQLTPYGWVNNVPVVTVDWPTAGWMTALGLALVVIGYLGYRRRDLLPN